MTKNQAMRLCNIWTNLKDDEKELRRHPAERYALVKGFVLGCLSTTTSKDDAGNYKLLYLILIIRQVQEAREYEAVSR